MIEAQMSIPHLFMCPISLDLINDPVTLSTGQTYDRSSIEKWLAAGNLTCPVTMQKLHDLTMVPNHTLRHLIDQWLQMGPELDRGYLTPVDSLAVLKRDLESPEANLKSFLPLVLQLVFGKVGAELSEECLKFVELGLSCVLGLLSLGEYESLNLLKEESKLESFEVLFEHGSISVKVSLCHVIEAISSSSATRDLFAMLGKRQRILHGLILLVLQRHGASEEAGIKAISALCTLHSIHHHSQKFPCCIKSKPSNTKSGTRDEKNNPTQPYPIEAVSAIK